MRWTARGTHRGPFMGMPPSNNKGQVHGISIDRFADGRIVEHHESFDSLTLFQIMGVVLPFDALMKGAQPQKAAQVPRA
jgi:predicted ester cyclase